MNKKYRKRMDIYSKPGTTVIFDEPTAGYPHDQETANKYLMVGKTYTVESTEVGSFHTDVRLVGFPNVDFNSVMFGRV